MITQEELKNLFDYVDGELIAKTNSKRRKTGKALGTLTPKGYLTASVHGRLHRVHRLVFLYFHGYIPEQVDHIDNNRTNNRIENLREATSEQNNHNRMPMSQSQIKGVYWVKESNKWVAAIGIKRKKIHLGTFQTIEEAALVATQARQKLHGEFARSTK
jgi:hypothetical protein